MYRNALLQFSDLLAEADFAWKSGPSTKDISAVTYGHSGETRNT